jgi:cytochrome P450
MIRRLGPDWDPQSEEVLVDSPAAYDELRRRCPVAYSEQLGWSLFRHADVMRVLEDHATFSNVVSKHHSVPNGMDPPEHTAYRRAIEPFFSEPRMRAFEARCREIARSLLEPLVASGTFDVVEAFATPFAVRCQCAFLGWPDARWEPLRRWTRDHQAAARAGDRPAMVELARELGAYVQLELQARRLAGSKADVTSELMGAEVNGAPLTDDDLTSILRNWTVGEIGSLAGSIGIVAARLADDGALQQQLRAAPAQLPAAIDELLRIEGPLVSNRRRATRDAEIGGRTIAAGERVTVMWTAANRDEEVFQAPDDARLDRDPRANLLYGAGIHVCPGAPLARLELRVAFEELLRGARRLQRAPGATALRALAPAPGWSRLPLTVYTVQ